MDRAIVSGKTRLLLFFSSFSPSLSRSFSLAWFFSLSRALSPFLSFFLSRRARHDGAAIRSQLGLFIYRIRNESPMSKSLFSTCTPLPSSPALFLLGSTFTRKHFSRRRVSPRFSSRIYISRFFRHLIVRRLKRAPPSSPHLSQLREDSVIARAREFPIAPGN